MRRVAAAAAPAVRGARGRPRTKGRPRSKPRKAVQDADIARNLQSRLRLLPFCTQETKHEGTASDYRVWIDNLPYDSTLEDLTRALGNVCPITGALSPARPPLPIADLQTAEPPLGLVSGVTLFRPPLSAALLIRRRRAEHDALENQKLQVRVSNVRPGCRTCPYLRSSSSMLTPPWIGLFFAAHGRGRSACLGLGTHSRRHARPGRAAGPAAPQAPRPAEGARRLDLRCDRTPRKTSALSFSLPPEPTLAAGQRSDLRRTARDRSQRGLRAAESIRMISSARATAASPSCATATSTAYGALGTSTSRGPPRPRRALAAPAAGQLREDCGEMFQQSGQDTERGGGRRHSRSD